MKRSLWQSEDGTALMECALVMDRMGVLEQ